MSILASFPGFPFSWPSGAFFLLLGWWGSPCRVFPSPLALAAFFLWVGWFPLPRFPGVFPLFLGWGGGCFSFCVFLLSLAFCIFLSLAARKTWSTDPQTPRPPPPRPFPWCICPVPVSLLGVDGRTRRGKGWGGDRGVCDPAHCLGIMIVASSVFCFPRGSPHPPESTLAVSPELESILGVWLFLFATSQRRLGFPLRLGLVVLALKVLHLVLSYEGLGQ